MCGIRPVDATTALLDELGTRCLADVLASDGPRGALTALYNGTIEPRPVVEACATSSRAEAAWVRDLAERYPDDPSVVATLLMNLVRLAPGEALHLEPGSLHAYLHGAAIELMGPSDNVVRAGLTYKPIDVAELLRIVDTTPLAEPVIQAADRYPLDAGVQLLLLEAGDIHRAVGHEVSIDLAGEAWYLGPGDERTVSVTTYAVTTLRASRMPADTTDDRYPFSAAGLRRCPRRARPSPRRRAAERRGSISSSSSRLGRGGLDRRR